MDNNLTTYATRLLLGTDLTPVTARSVAAGITPASTPAEHTLRDGWTASARATLAAPSVAVDEGES